jgi:cobalt/nickel transport system permease protein
MAIYGAAILGVVWASRVSGSILLRRLSIESAFIGAVLLGTLFRGDGEIVWQWGILRVTTTGLTILGSVALKALLSLTLLNVLTLTTEVPALLHALKTLKMPPLLVAVLAAMVRYLSVLIEEFAAMRRAALSRNLMNSNHWQRMVVGNMIGALFIRTYERGERVHQAMLSRGYEGVPLFQNPPQVQPLDRIVVALTCLLAFLGQAVYWFDRI